MNDDPLSPEDLATHYPYRLADLDRVPPSHIRPGHLLAFRGPHHHGHMFGTRQVTHTTRGEHCAFFHCDIYIIELANGSTIRQPEASTLFILRPDLIRKTATLPY